MGIDSASVLFLCAAKSLGVDFDRTLTVGRQGFYPDAAMLTRVFSILGVSENVETFLKSNRFSEAFFRVLGANEADSMDYSSYEGATILHDMNMPIADDLR